MVNNGPVYNGRQPGSMSVEGIRSQIALTKELRVLLKPGREDNADAVFAAIAKYLHSTYGDHIPAIKIQDGWVDEVKAHITQGDRRGALKVINSARKTKEGDLENALIEARRTEQVPQQQAQNISHDDVDEIVKLNYRMNHVAPLIQKLEQVQASEPSTIESFRRLLDFETAQDPDNKMLKLVLDLLLQPKIELLPIEETKAKLTDAKTIMEDFLVASANRLKDMVAERDARGDTSVSLSPPPLTADSVLEAKLKEQKETTVANSAYFDAVLTLLTNGNQSAATMLINSSVSTQPECARFFASWQDVATEMIAKGDIGGAREYLSLQKLNAKEAEKAANQAPSGNDGQHI